jgi:hypothetical protein
MDKAGAIHTAKRRHMLRRFAKARKYACTLADIADERADARTATEAGLYRDGLQALELFEKVCCACKKELPVQADMHTSSAALPFIAA